MEEWKVCEEHTNYSVSNLGNVKNNKTGRILKCVLNNGYIKVSLGKGNTTQLHRLVGKTFLPNLDNLPEIDHINNDPTDNKLENLRWITRSDNQRRKPKLDGKHSKYKGVSWDKTERKQWWVARARFQGKQIYLGYFKTEEEGALAYNEFLIAHSLEEYTPLNILV
jgi:hypothetical protein